MASIQFFQLTAVPGVWQANSLYWIEDAGGTTATTYITDAVAVPHDVGNTNYITSVVNPLIATALAGVYNEVQIAADITARDALTLTQNTMVLVTDASGDGTVNAGAALYMWDNTATNYTKLTEFESLDVTTTWGDIVGKPASTTTQIDAAVSATHTHANKAELDKIGEDVGGNMTYGGTAITGITDWTTTAW